MNPRPLSHVLRERFLEEDADWKCIFSEILKNKAELLDCDDLRKIVYHRAYIYEATDIGYLSKAYIDMLCKLPFPTAFIYKFFKDGCKDRTSLKEKCMQIKCELDKSCICEYCGNWIGEGGETVLEDKVALLGRSKFGRLQCYNVDIERIVETQIANEYRFIGLGKEYLDKYSDINDEISDFIEYFYVKMSEDNMEITYDLIDFIGALKYCAGLGFFGLRCIFGIWYVLEGDVRRSDDKKQAVLNYFNNLYENLGGKEWLREVLGSRLYIERAKYNSNNWRNEFDRFADDILNYIKKEYEKENSPLWKYEMSEFGCIRSYYW